MLNLPSHPLKLLVVGSGGREHALCWKLAQSPLIEKIFCAPGNGGTARESKTENLAVDSLDFKGLSSFCLSNKIDLVVIGPDNPLAEGIVDFLEKDNIRVFGPKKKAAKLEWSKSYAKEFMSRYGLPTPRYLTCKTRSETEQLLNKNPWAKVIKVDGLALGKGVYVCDTVSSIEKAIAEIFEQNKFGQASETIILEEKVTGEELSLLVLCDGKTLLPLASSQDYKRRFDGNKGPNTGGMGAYSPVDLYDQYRAQIEKDILSPLEKAMHEENLDYRGILYIGIMVGKSESDKEIKPTVLEFNARFGDPETQALLPRIESDLLPALWACTEGQLSEVEIKWKKEASCCVVAVARNYPESSSKGEPISLSDSKENIFTFHAGTKVVNDTLVTAGGRILCVTALAKDTQSASELAYSGISQAHFTDMDYRHDIAKLPLESKL